VIAREQAPVAFGAWDELLGALAWTLPPDLMEEAGAIARAGLDPTAPAVPTSAAVTFASQMVVDVASISADVRAAGLAELGATGATFLLAVWAQDMQLRAGTAWRALFGDAWDPTPAAATDPWTAHERFLLEVAKLSSLDPVTSELVRLRGARAHDCRLCQSRRNVTAIDLAGGRALFEDADPVGLSGEQTLVLHVVDTFVWQPTRWPEGLGRQVLETLGSAAATELVLDIVRNAANKIAVAFGVDDPQVESGVEYYAIDESTGDLRYDVAPAIHTA
jgi:hypothetical protein